jgi:plasmid stability protein
MSATITLKNIPDDLYERLKQVAELHHRSLNREVIACLEHALLPTRVSAEERIARARTLRARLPEASFSVEEVQEAIKEGRP